MQPGARWACRAAFIMPIMKLIYIALLALGLSLASCSASYDVDKSDELAQIALADTTLTQETYSRMIKTLDEGYSYMRARIAHAAFETNPTAAINDIINFMGDTTLSAVQRHSVILINTLRKAPLDKKNAARFRNVLHKYDELEQSLVADSTAIEPIVSNDARVK